MDSTVLPVIKRKYVEKVVAEKTLELDKAFPNFNLAMQDLYAMGNTFGLCGLISLILCGIRDGKWIWYDQKINLPGILQDFNDTVAELKLNPASTRETPLNRFLRQSYPRIVEHGKSVKRADLLERELWDAWSEGFQVRVAVMCKYPRLDGVYTHWLSVLGFVEYCVAIGGDLTPFGINDRYIVAVDQSKFFDMVADVLGKEATIAGSKQLRVGYAYSQDKKGDTFINNFRTIDFSKF